MSLTFLLARLYTIADGREFADVFLDEEEEKENRN